MKKKFRGHAESRTKGAMLSYGTVVTALGPVHVACSERGVAAVQIGGSADAWLRHLQKKYSIGAAKKPAAVRTAAVQIREYLAGRRRSFDVRIDWRGMSPFQRRVLRATTRIPYGRVRTYGEIARNAARAAGQALGANPLPLIIPCHRVVASGGLGGYSAAGGVRLKRKILDLERKNFVTR
jgi:methylated-DNA-[protein]-cysteine S-methyltransferase